MVREISTGTHILTECGQSPFGRKYLFNAPAKLFDRLGHLRAFRNTYLILNFSGRTPILFRWDSIEVEANKRRTTYTNIARPIYAGCGSTLERKLTEFRERSPDKTFVLGPSFSISRRSNHLHSTPELYHASDTIWERTSHFPKI